MWCVCFFSPQDTDFVHILLFVFSLHRTQTLFIFCPELINRTHTIMCVCSTVICMNFQGPKAVDLFVRIYVQCVFL